MAKLHLEHVEQFYLPHVAEARARLVSDDRFGRLLRPGVDPLELMGFLLHYDAFGVDMTEPVEGWIRRAGERCSELGYTQLGKALIAHARHEAGHQQMMIDDCALLCRRWNEVNVPAVSPETLRSTPRPAAVTRYHEIHEDTIGSDHPFGQLAIETEVEGLSTVLGPPLVRACKEVLGPEILDQMSFITEHVALDVGHTAMNLAELEKLLAAHPEHGEPLGRIGSEALMIYLDFLAECAARGSELAQRAREARARRGEPRGFMRI